MSDVLKFLGATVINYNSNVGYNNQESTFDVALVEDLRDGDTFHLSNNLTREGHPVYFRHGAFFFGGVIRTWSHSNSAQGRTFSVSCSDPRIFFDGISLIINDYTATSSVPNVINVYGYLESIKYGNSGKNEAGVSVSKLLTALKMMRNSRYNGGISYFGINYDIDISGVPHPPAEFRLSQTVISFSDFLNEIAEVTSSTYTVYLYLSSRKVWTIGFIFSGRAAMPTRGAIQQYIATRNDASVRNNGIELVNETTTKMVFGGNKTDMYLQNHVPDFMSIDNPIFGYYGRDLTGNLAMPYSKHRNFPIDARNISINGLGDIYYSNDDELRAAISSIDIWKSYLVSMWPYEYIPESDGAEVAYAFMSVRNEKKAKENKNGSLDKKGKQRIKAPVQDEYFIRPNPNMRYRHNGIPNPHYLKAIYLKLDSNASVDVTSSLTNGTNWGFNPTLIESYMKKGDEEGRLFDNPVDTLYSLISNFANENHGRRFLVQVPEIKMAVEPDTNLRRYNIVPTDGGYIDASQFRNAVANNLLPSNVITLTLEDNRLACYVRFDDVANLNLSEIGADNVVFNDAETSAFVRCEVEPELAFIDYQNATGARALITLPGRVFRKTEDKSGFLMFMNQRLLTGLYDLSSEDLIGSLSSKSEDELIEFARNRYGLGMDTRITGLYEKTSLRAAKKAGTLVETITALIGKEKDTLDSNLSKLSSETSFNGDFAKEFVHPNFAAIPLLSTVDFYGPWVSSVGTGKTDVEYDSNLVPWNFNGFDVMNRVASAKVNDIAGNLTWSETGSIDIPGVPLCSLGQKLMNSGPYVSDISVSIGTDGFMTSYKMSSWTPRFSKISNAMSDKLARVTKTAQTESRNAIERFRIRKRAK